MNYESVEKKAWVTPSIEETSVQTTEAKLVVSPFEIIFGGASGDQPSGPS